MLESGSGFDFSPNLFAPMPALIRDSNSDHFNALFLAQYPCFFDIRL